MYAYNLFPIPSLTHTHPSNRAFTISPLFYEFHIQLSDLLVRFPAIELDMDRLRANLQKDVDEHLRLIEAFKTMGAADLRAILDANDVAEAHDAQEANAEMTNGPIPPRVPLLPSVEETF